MSMNVLIVDDINTNIIYLEALFEDLKRHIDIDLLTALNANDAIDICLKNDVHLILSDVEMPEVDGIAMAKILKSNSITKDIPIVFITAKEQTDEFIENTLGLGAVDFFVKPVEKYRLLTKVQLYLDLFAKKNELEQYKKVINNSTICAKFDLDGNITFTNDWLCQISGYTCEDVTGKPYKMFTSPHVKEEYCQTIWNTLKKEGHWEGIIEKKAKNGESYFVKESISVIYNTRNEPVEYMSLAEDITEFKKLQLEELGQSVHKALNLNMEKLVESIPLPTVIIDNDSIIKYHNDLCDEFAPIVNGAALGKCFIQDDEYIYDDGILDWKDVALSYEGQAKVLINDSGIEKKFYLDIKKLDNDELFIVCLHYIEEEF